MNVTIKDIARKTGYSINTVSRALKNKQDVKAETRDIIIDAANEMGYVANALAGSLRSNRRNVIGVLLSADSSNPVFSEIIQGVETSARSYGFNIILINTEQDIDKQKAGIDILLSQQVDGLIIMPVADPSFSNETFLRLPCPFIFLGRNVNGLTSHSVMFDDVMGAHIAATYFLERRISNILFLEGPKGFSSTIDRKQGFFSALKKHDLEPDEKYCIKTDGHMHGGYDAINYAYNHSIDFKAIITYNDLVAYGAIRALHDLKISVPESVQVIGYDNLEISRFLFPRLTSMDTPRLELGKLAAIELIKHIKDSSAPYENITLQTMLVQGETTLT